MIGGRQSSAQNTPLFSQKDGGSGEGKTSFPVKRGFPFPRTPILFEKSGIFWGIVLQSGAFPACTAAALTEAEGQCAVVRRLSPARTVAEIASHHPETKFVLAHMAGIYQNGHYPYFPNMDSLEDVMEIAGDNVYIDTAHFLMYVYPGVMEKMYRLAGPDHIVFGTDAPLQGPMQMRFAIEVIQALDIPQADKDKILFRNARKILGLS